MRRHSTLLALSLAIAVIAAGFTGYWVRVLVETSSAAPPSETCLGGRFMVQFPDNPDGWLVSYDGIGGTQVQICGVNMHMGGRIQMPNYESTIVELEARVKELEGR